MKEKYNIRSLRVMNFASEECDNLRKYRRMRTIQSRLVGGGGGGGVADDCIGKIAGDNMEASFRIIPVTQCCCCLSNVFLYSGNRLVVSWKQARK